MNAVSFSGTLFIPLARSPHVILSAVPGFPFCLRTTGILRPPRDFSHALSRTPDPPPGFFGRILTLPSTGSRLRSGPYRLQLPFFFFAPCTTCLPPDVALGTFSDFPLEIPSGLSFRTPGSSLSKPDPFWLCPLLPFILSSAYETPPCGPVEVRCCYFFC